MPTSNGNNRNPDGTFAVGNPGGPGRPFGSVSIVAKIKQKFQENPEYFDEWVGKLMEDAGNRRAIMEQLDGKPHQTTDITTKGQSINSMASLPTEELERITTESTG